MYSPEGVVNDTLGVVFGTSEQRKTLEQAGCEVLEEVPGVPFHELRASLAGPSRPGMPPAGYRSPEELRSDFEDLVASHPDMVKIVDVTQEMGVEPTLEGRHIFALKISDNVDVDEDEPNVLVVSNHHCRELITPELAYDIARRLLSAYDDDAKIKAAVDNTQIYVIWTMNPDGLAYVWSTNAMWRKNRRPNAGGSFGVDLNRNYPVGWDYSCAGSTLPTSETYRGTAPASEAETLTMLAFQRDRNFAKILDFHSYAREVRIPYGSCANLPRAVDNLYISTAATMANLMNYQQVRSCCMGGNIHTGYAQQGALSFLVETGTAFQPPAEQMEAELVRIWPGALWFLTELDIPLNGHVMDGEGNGLVAELSVAAIDFEENEAFFSTETGRYHLWLPAGIWTVTASHADYPPVTVDVVVTARGSTLSLIHI